MISHAHKFIFIHIPKTGGLSVVDALMPYCDEKEYTHGHPYQSTYYDFCDAGNYYQFSFVRNPWARAFSTFNYSLSWHEANSSELPHYLIDKDFNKYVENYDFWTKTNKTTYFEYTEGCDFIGKQENLQQDFDELCSLIGLQERSLEHLNVTDKKIEKKNKYHTYRDHYNSKSKDTIYKKFKKDIETFNYEY